MTLEDFKEYAIMFEPVGSRVTCNPPPTDTDEDWLACVSNAVDARSRLEGMGFKTTTEAEYDGLDSKFTSFKLGNLNVIVTDSYEFFNRFMAASHVAKRLNLLKKEDRIALFQAVLYANQYEGGVK